MRKNKRKIVLDDKKENVEKTPIVLFIGYYKYDKYNKQLDILDDYQRAIKGLAKSYQSVIRF